MKLPSLSVLAALTAGALAASPASAQSLRCQNDLVSVGDSRAAVFQKCGEPAFRDSFCKTVNAEPVTSRVNAGVGPLACIGVDEWTYKPGYGQFMTTLRFEEGTLKAIQYGDRVK